MMRLKRIIILTLICVLLFSTSGFAKKTKPKILLAGSSSIYLWQKNAKKIFKSYCIINKAIRGSTTEDWLRLYKKRIIKYKPQIILFYCGANDIQDGQGTSGIANAANTKKLFALIHEKLPNTKIFYISINHVNRNPHAWGQIDTSNSIMHTYCEKHKNTYYINLVPYLLLPNGIPNDDFYRLDQLHPNKLGFKIWNQVIGDYVKNELKKGNK